MTTTDQVASAGFDAIAVKPSKQSLESLDTTTIDTIVIDYEGNTALPQPEHVTALAREAEVIMTTPIRADGFDPLGDDRLFDRYGADRFVLVAGNPTYLSQEERERAIAPRIGEARQRFPSAWVGTEGIERLALATGATQFELLSRRTPTTMSALRAAGFDGELALYAPTVITEDRAIALEALEGYLSRRKPVKRALANGNGTESKRSHVLLQAMDDYALVGDVDAVSRRIESLRTAGVNTVVGYPAPRK